MNFKKVILGLSLGLSLAAIPVVASADRDQGTDLSKYQGYTAVFGQPSDKFTISQIGGYYDGTFRDQPTYTSQVASTIAQGKRAHTYIYGQFSTKDEADQMLNYYLPKIQTPKNSIVALDVESGNPNTEAVRYALNKIQNAGYTAVLYGYLNFLTAHLDLSSLADSFPLWLAEYPDYNVRTTPNYKYFPSFKNVHLFQFTSTYAAGGLDGNVDLLEITKNGYDGTKTTAVGSTAVKTDSTTTAIKQGQKANATPKSNIVVGYTVKVNFGATKWANGTSIPSWVKGKSYKVQQVSGNKVLLAGILSWINRSDIEILQTAGQAKKVNPGLSVDGILGKQTILALQKIYNMRVQDGVISKPSSLVKVLQKHLGVTQDGYLGYYTISAMQRRLGTPQDGKISTPSQLIKAIQKKLNNNQKPF